MAPLILFTIKIFGSPDLKAILIDSCSVNGIKNFSPNNLELLELSIPSSVIVSILSFPGERI